MRCFLLMLLTIPLYPAVETLTPVWVEAGPDGAVMARVVIAQRSECPSISINSGNPVIMSLRLPVPKNFQPVCEFPIRPGTKHAKVGTKDLILPKGNPSRVAVIGDTGCRVKGAVVQACNDPKVWPFAMVAMKAAAEKPQLVIHVGDYLYRESPCPAADRKQCGDSPNGDNWETWNADFFKPASTLLTAAPWAFTRGNHEACSRSWRGWFYYLDPRPFSEVCRDYSEPYLVTLGSFQLLMVDSSAAQDNRIEAAQLAKYTSLLKPYASTRAWLVEHHPMWGLRREQAGIGDAPLTAVMRQAYEAAGLLKIELILAGHTHLFEILSYATGRPPQIVAGDAGTALANEIQKDLKGETVFGTKVEGGTSRHEFGFTTLRRHGDRWELTLKNPAAQTLVSCSIQGKKAHCKGST